MFVGPWWSLWWVQMPLSRDGRTQLLLYGHVMLPGPRESKTCMSPQFVIYLRSEGEKCQNNLLNSKGPVNTENSETIWLNVKWINLPRNQNGGKGLRPHIHSLYGYLSRKSFLNELKQSMAFSPQKIRLHYKLPLNSPRNNQYFH